MILLHKILKYKKDDKLRRQIAMNGHKNIISFSIHLVARYIIDKSFGISSKYYLGIIFEMSKCSYIKK